MEKAKVNVYERFEEYLSMYGNEIFIPMLNEKDLSKIAQGKWTRMTLINIWMMLVSVGMNSMVHS